MLGKIEGGRRRGRQRIRWLDGIINSRDMSLSKLHAPRTAAWQHPLSMGFSKQDYWNGLPFPSPGDLPDPKIEPWSPALQADSLPSEPPGEPQILHSLTVINIY